MSWVLVIWSTAAAASLTLAAIHLMVWLKKRTAWVDLAFSLTSVATAGMAGTELWMIRAGTVDQFATALRWAHVPILAMIVTLALFTRLYLRAGRVWLAWGAVTARTLSTVFDFLVGPNINFRVMTGPRHIRFLGELVSVPQGVPNPLMLVAQLGTLLLVVFIADAARSAWRRGNRRAALAVGGSALFFVLAAMVHSALVLWQILPAPAMNSLFYVGIVAAMAYELTRDALQAEQLAGDLRESEARYRSILERSGEGIYRASVDGRILFANPAAAKMLGYDSPEDLMNSVTDLGSQVWALPEERSHLIQWVEEGGAVRGYECRFRRKDGTLIWVSLNSRPLRGPDGRILYFDGMLENVDERKRADEALRQSEERFRALAESALVGIYILQDGRYAYVNPAMARVFGYSVAEMTGMTPREIVQPSDHEIVGENIRRRITGEVPAIQYEVRGRYKDGSIRDVEVYGSRVEINGRPALIGTLIDITERKKSDAALDKSRGLLAEIERIGRVGGWEIDIGTMKQTWTQEIYNIHEVDPAFEPTVENGIGFYTPDSRPVIARLVRRAIEFGEPFDAELEIVTAKGRRRCVHAVGRADLPHGRVYGFFQDITEHKKAETALAESQEHYRTLFDMTPAGIIVVDSVGKVLMANSAHARMYGYGSPQELIGFESPLFLAEQDRQRAFREMSTLLEGNGRAERVYTAVRRDGSEFTVEVTFAVLWGPSHDVQGYLCLSRDITKSLQDETERNELRFERNHLARLLAVNEMSTSLAHEINQPLGAILNNAEAARILLSRAHGREAVPEIIDDIIRDAQRAGDVIRKVRSVVKKSDVSFEPLPINPLIDETLEILRNNLALNNVSLHLELGPDLADVRGDRVRLQQVLLNLVTNALDAMKEAPTRILAIGSTMDGPDTVTVGVGDSGPGIPEARREEIFQPFFTTKKGGLGLGLAICRSIVEEHGGRVWVESGPAGGARFSFSLKAWREGSA